jgi:hypothetical protein
MAREVSVEFCVGGVIVWIVKNIKLEVNDHQEGREFRYIPSL